MSDHRERACAECGSPLHHEDDCAAVAKPVKAAPDAATWIANAPTDREMLAALAAAEDDLAGERDAALSRAENAERERDELRKVLDTLQPPRVENTHLRFAALGAHERAGEVGAWLIESTCRMLRAQIEAAPVDKRNRVTITVSWLDELWNLTFARGDYESAMERQRDAALAQLATLREAVVEVEEARAALDSCTAGFFSDEGLAVEARFVRALDARRAALADLPAATEARDRALVRGTVRLLDPAWIESGGEPTDQQADAIIASVRGGQ